jgi:hypothetical protein
MFFARQFLDTSNPERSVVLVDGGAGDTSSSDRSVRAFAEFSHLLSAVLG